MYIRTEDMEWMNITGTLPSHKVARFTLYIREFEEKILWLICIMGKKRPRACSIKIFYFIYSSFMFLYYC